MKKKMILWSVAIAMCGGILGIWLIDGTAPFKEALQKIRGQRSQSMMEEIPWEEGQVGTAGMIRQLERIDIATTIPNCRFQSCAIVDELLRMPLPKDWKERYAYESDLLSELTNCGRLKEAAERIKMLENTGIFTKLDDLYLSKWYSANGIHYLRNGEVVNCVTNHNETSCIFPLVDKAFHTDKTGASKAIEMYTKALNLNPDDLSSRWLINIAFMQLGVYPEAVPEKWLIEFTPKYPEAEIAPFRNIAAEVGVDFGDMCGAVILDDFNGDGLIDIFQAGWGLDETVHYMENAGDGTFKDQTKSAGLEHYPGGLMMQQTDYNNDGYLDMKASPKIESLITTKFGNQNEKVKIHRKPDRGYS